MSISDIQEETILRLTAERDAAQEALRVAASLSESITASYELKINRDAEQISLLTSNLDQLRGLLARVLTVIEYNDSIGSILVDDIKRTLREIP